MNKNKNIKFIDEYKSFVAISGNFSHAKPHIEDLGNETDIYSYSHQFYSYRTDPHIDASDFYASF
jgi:hypothetical protein